MLVACCTAVLVSVMRVIYRKIRHARYLHIKRNIEKVRGARYTLGARYLSKNTATLIPEEEDCVCILHRIVKTFQCSIH